MHLCFPALCLALPLALPAAAQAVDLSQIRSVFGKGDIYGIATDDAQTRAYVGEGAQVTVLDISPCNPPGSCSSPAVVARVPVDCSVMSLVRHDRGTDKAVFVAGGSMGLFKMSADEAGNPPLNPCCLGQPGGPFPVTQIDDAGELWCWDVAIGQASPTSTYVVAIYGGREAPGSSPPIYSELRVYRRGTLGLVAIVPIITGDTDASGYAVSIQRRLINGVPSYGSKAWIALGTGGVWVADLAGLATGSGVTLTQVTVFGSTGTLSCPNSTCGPFVPACSPLAGLTLTPPENGRVRDVAVAPDGSVFAAADNWGLIEIDPGCLCIKACVPLVLGSSGSYASRVGTTVVHGTDATVATWVVVTGSRDSSRHENTAPFINYGRFGPYGEIGGYFGSSTPGVTAQYIFRKPAGGDIDTSPAYTNTFSAGYSGGNVLVRATDNASDGRLTVYEQPYGFWGLHAGLPVGLKVFHHTAQASFTPDSTPYTYTGEGNGTFCAFQSLLAPDRAVTLSEGSSGNLSIQALLDLSDSFCPVLASPGLANPGGIFESLAHWTTADADGGSSEWFFTMPLPNLGWRLNRLRTPGATPTIDVWTVHAPRMPDCAKPRNYAHITGYFDPLAREQRVLGTIIAGQYGPGGADPFRASRWGGVVYRRDDLVSKALATTPGINSYICPPPTDATTCQCLYVSLVETHPELASWVACQPHVNSLTPAWTMQSRVVDYDFPDGPHSVAVIADGFFANDTDLDLNGIADDPRYSSGMLALVDLSAAGRPITLSDCANPGDCTASSPCGGVAATSLPAIGTAYGPALGNALAVDVADSCGRRYAFVADFGGRILLFEITDPFAPSFVSAWVLPLNALDQHLDNVYDVAVDLDGPGGDPDYVYFTAYRAGYNRLELTITCGNPPTIAFPATSWTATGVTHRDTPGLAHDLAFWKDAQGEAKGVLVGDKMGGVRLYGSFSGGMPPTCP